MVVSDNPADLVGADKVVIPGVGAFADAMNNLNTMGWTSALRQAVLEQKKYVLGICLGMQLLADVGFESGQTPGLGLIPGSVVRLMSKNLFERIPHVGWNEIYQTASSPLFNNVPDGSDFYFVHSYTVAAPADAVIATTPYCGSFAAAVNVGRVFGVQFHPEKSTPVGFEVLKNFLAL